MLVATPGPWKIYECDFYADDKTSQDWVCGITNAMGAAVVESDAGEECSHTVLLRVDAELICTLRNKEP